MHKFFCALKPHHLVGTYHSGVPRVSLNPSTTCLKLDSSHRVINRYHRTLFPSSSFFATGVFLPSPFGDNLLSPKPLGPLANTIMKPQASLLSLAIASFTLGIAGELERKKLNPIPKHSLLINIFRAIRAKITAKARMGSCPVCTCPSGKRSSSHCQNLSTEPSLHSGLPITYPPRK